MNSTELNRLAECSVDFGALVQNLAVRMLVDTKHSSTTGVTGPTHPAVRHHPWPQTRVAHTTEEGHADGGGGAETEVALTEPLAAFFTEQGLYATAWLYGTVKTLAESLETLEQERAARRAIAIQAPRVRPWTEQLALADVAALDETDERECLAGRARGGRSWREREILRTLRLLANRQFREELAWEFAGTLATRTADVGRAVGITFAMECMEVAVQRVLSSRHYVGGAGGKATGNDKSGVGKRVAGPGTTLFDAEEGAMSGVSLSSQILRPSNSGPCMRCTLFPAGCNDPRHALHRLKASVQHLSAGLVGLHTRVWSAQVVCPTVSGGARGAPGTALPNVFARTARGRASSTWELSHTTAAYLQTIEDIVCGGLFESEEEDGGERSEGALTPASRACSNPALAAAVAVWCRMPRMLCMELSISTITCHRTGLELPLEPMPVNGGDGGVHEVEGVWSAVVPSGFCATPSSAQPATATPTMEGTPAMTPADAIPTPRHGGADTPKPTKTAKRATTARRAAARKGATANPVVGAEAGSGRDDTANGSSTWHGRTSVHPDGTTVNTTTLGAHTEARERLRATAAVAMARLSTDVEHAIVGGSAGVDGTHSKTTPVGLAGGSISGSDWRFRRDTENAHDPVYEQLDVLLSSRDLSGTLQKQTTLRERTPYGANAADTLIRHVEHGTAVVGHLCGEAVGALTLDADTEQRAPAPPTPWRHGVYWLPCAAELGLSDEALYRSGMHPSHVASRVEYTLASRISIDGGGLVAIPASLLLKGHAGFMAGHAHGAQLAAIAGAAVVPAAEDEVFPATIRMSFATGVPAVLVCATVDPVVDSPTSHCAVRTFVGVPAFAPADGGPLVPRIPPGLALAALGLSASASAPANTKHDDQSPGAVQASLVLQRNAMLHRLGTQPATFNHMLCKSPKLWIRDVDQMARQIDSEAEPPGTGSCLPGPGFHHEVFHDHYTIPDDGGGLCHDDKSLRGAQRVCRTVTHAKSIRIRTPVGVGMEIGYASWRYLTGTSATGAWSAWTASPDRVRTARIKIRASGAAGHHTASVCHVDPLVTVDFQDQLCDAAFRHVSSETLAVLLGRAPRLVTRAPGWHALPADGPGPTTHLRGPAHAGLLFAAATHVVRCSVGVKAAASPSPAISPPPTTTPAFLHPMLAGVHDNAVPTTKAPPLLAWAVECSPFTLALQHVRATAHLSSSGGLCTRSTGPESQGWGAFLAPRPPPTSAVRDPPLALRASDVGRRALEEAGCLLSRLDEPDVAAFVANRASESPCRLCHAVRHDILGCHEPVVDFDRAFALARFARLLTETYTIPTIFRASLSNAFGVHGVLLCPRPLCDELKASKRSGSKASKGDAAQDEGAVAQALLGDPGKLKQLATAQPGLCTWVVSAWSPDVFFANANASGNGDGEAEGAVDDDGSDGGGGDDDTPDLPETGDEEELDADPDADADMDVDGDGGDEDDDAADPACDEAMKCDEEDDGAGDDDDGDASQHSADGSEENEEGEEQDDESSGEEDEESSAASDGEASAVGEGPASEADMSEDGDHTPLRPPSVGTTTPRPAAARRPSAAVPATLAPSAAEGTPRAPHTTTSCIRATVVKSGGNVATTTATTAHKRVSFAEAAVSSVAHGKAPATAARRDNHARARLVVAVSVTQSPKTMARGGALGSSLITSYPPTIAPYYDQRSTVACSAADAVACFGLTTATSSVERNTAADNDLTAQHIGLVLNALTYKGQFNPAPRTATESGGPSGAFSVLNPTKVMTQALAHSSHDPNAHRLSRTTVGKSPITGSGCVTPTVHHNTFA